MQTCSFLETLLQQKKDYLGIQHLWFFRIEIWADKLSTGRINNLILVFQNNIFYLLSIQQISLWRMGPEFCQFPTWRTNFLLLNSGGPPSHLFWWCSLDVWYILCYIFASVALLLWNSLVEIQWAPHRDKFTHNQILLAMKSLDNKSARGAFQACAKLIQIKLTACVKKKHQGVTIYLREEPWAYISDKILVMVKSTL